MQKLSLSLMAAKIDKLAASAEANNQVLARCIDKIMLHAVHPVELADIKEDIAALRANVRLLDKAINEMRWQYQDVPKTKVNSDASTLPNCATRQYSARSGVARTPRKTRGRNQKVSRGAKA